MHGATIKNNGNIPTCLNDLMCNVCKNKSCTHSHTDSVGQGPHESQPNPITNLPKAKNCCGFILTGISSDRRQYSEISGNKYANYYRDKGDCLSTPTEKPCTSSFGVF